jgi:NAD-dependent DNA ligase
MKRIRNIREIDYSRGFNVFQWEEKIKELSLAGLEFVITGKLETLSRQRRKNG